MNNNSNNNNNIGNNRNNNITNNKSNNRNNNRNNNINNNINNKRIDSEKSGPTRFVLPHNFEWPKTELRASSLHPFGGAVGRRKLARF